MSGLRPILESSRRLVVKLGSSLVAPPSGRGASLPGLARDLAALDAEATLVSSGAVALGRGRTGRSASDLPARQALSAIGQPRLMRLWQDAFAETGREVAQILLTPDVTEDRARYLNARAALRAVHAMGAIPIVNENDAVATEELRSGDNDRLAAQTAGLIGADTLVLLSDVDGLYDRDPSEAGAAHVPFVSRESLGGYDTARMVSRSGVGTGGMGSKVRAAALASGWGVRVVIASGRSDSPIGDLLRGDARCTVFEARDERAPARRRWLSSRAHMAGRVHVDAGAAAALRRGASLLAVGVRDATGGFEAGDLLRIEGPDGPVAFGLASCSEETVRSGEAKIVVHRDDLVLEG
ncbi:glutamate 5-kinase [Parvularcula dongshanensis]|uniref:Glutamate 5-kinase n=1 Tax=Parvularcula dongshanensis TaxID=1173995 RepID=A0A840I1F2_9PROT|nr:glutamate 5-kinase [Parvularcula dongshanensis]MBB4658866.1 glutamate 5-kinase [Parvularcula dongshanensis]